MKKPCVKILICAHKEVELPKHDYFLPVQAGAESHEPISGFVPDNTGDNISIKNKSYCELTCHYWAWKNLKNVDVIGLNHYRRYFDFHLALSQIAPDRRFADVKSFLDTPYQFPDLESLFSKYDIILPNTRNYSYSMATQYAVYHIVDDWRILKDIIRELSPEYIPTFEKTMEQRNYSSNYNMFITRWNLFDEYSEWLFKVLFEVEKRCKISSYDVQARIFGYMSERLINVFCEYHHLRIKHYPLVVPIDDFQPWMNPSVLKYNYWKFKNNLAYIISKS